MADMTLAQVARAAGTSASYLSLVERGQANASSLYFGRVASVIAARLTDAA